MTLFRITASIAAWCVVSTAALAQAPGAAPAGSTGLCKDGSYTTNATKSGACSGHRGVKSWFAAAGAAAAPTTPTTPAASAPTATKPTATAARSASPAPTTAKPAAATPVTMAAPAVAKPAVMRPAVVPAATPVAAAPTTAPPARATPVAAAPRASTPAPSAAAAPGGGVGQVWVNSGTHVYHCLGTRYYGKTKQGAYMTEDAAKAAGNHGKSCS